jgi:hypothetical protein
MSDQIRINGNLMSWGSIILKMANGNTYTGITGVSYADKRERVKGWGQGRHHAPYGRSSGKYTPDPVKITVYKHVANAIRKDLAAQSPDGTSYGNTVFEIAIQYVEFSLASGSVDIQQCVLVGNSSNEEENPDPLKEELEIDCMRIKRDGLTLYDVSQGSP